MNIMKNYEQKYKEALARARVVNPGTKDYNIVTTIFPELKENVGERIRALIEWSKSYAASGITIDDSEEMIAWLEKQSNISPTKDELEALRIAAYEPTKNWSEKLQSLHEKLTRCKQCGQKSNNKIESKFKIGDWITFYGRPPFKILKIEAEYNGTLDYLLLGQNGHDSFFNKKYVDENARLWTIYDAKKGDILQANNCTLIFDSLAKDIDGNTVISSWYYCNTKTFYGIGTCKPDLWAIEGVTPATQEQCDFLFAKMKEAGYEYDTTRKKIYLIGKCLE